MLFCEQGHVENNSCDQAILFLHGFLGSSQDWKSYLEHFSSKGHRTFAPDLPGHGHSLIYELDELISITPKNAHLVGYSMGGRIALYLQKKYPDHFASMTLISSNPGLISKTEIAKRVLWEKKVIDDLKTLSLDDFVDAWYKQDLFSDFKPPEHRFKQNRDGLIDSFRKFSIAKLPSLWDYLPQIQVPTQMIFGAKDLKYDNLKKEVEKIDTQNRIKTYSVENCGHPVHLQNPALVSEIIENVLRQAVKDA